MILTAQIVHLETKLKTMDNEIHKLRSERKKELSLTRQKNAEVEESLQESAREEKDELRRKVELLKVEVRINFSIIASTLEDHLVKTIGNHAKLTLYYTWLAVTPNSTHVEMCRKFGQILIF